MSHCTIDLQSDFNAISSFVVNNPGLMLMYVITQVFSQIALSKAAVSSLNLVQRLTLTIIMTCLLFAARSVLDGRK